MPPIATATTTDNAADCQVVVELAHRLDEGPAISADHQIAVSGVDQRHARGK